MYCQSCQSLYGLHLQVVLGDFGLIRKTLKIKNTKVVYKRRTKFIKFEIWDGIKSEWIENFPRGNGFTSSMSSWSVSTSIFRSAANAILSMLIRKTPLCPKRSQRRNLRTGRSPDICVCAVGESEGMCWRRKTKEMVRQWKWLSCTFQPNRRTITRADVLTGISSHSPTPESHRSTNNFTGITYCVFSKGITLYECPNQHEQAKIIPAPLTHSIIQRTHAHVVTLWQPLKSPNLYDISTVSKKFFEFVLL